MPASVGRVEESARAFAIGIVFAGRKPKGRRVNRTPSGKS
jgi:hypothetical protein